MSPRTAEASAPGLDLITDPLGTLRLVAVCTETSRPRACSALVALAWSLFTTFGTLTCGSAATTSTSGSAFFAFVYAAGFVLITVPGSTSSR